ncbi:hypothetical protein BCV69DRAFT_280928 [Microstroma glucosiphilum]|uniref:RRN6 beta-propeller domain-containing protein n=1 Tax=Pseudomicrostroma glucosiphilum TaxID=1684307 RepID=A0A316UG20_9BASI|nr:hypothetical protein BCV69DRAFT_280928 [Pseudomicrostroma glucosiphilum]PWN23321.1 hypothetical protein BCV69DRAFT_280928 [Pseudomicrostroma glucosiphilum]
MVQNLAATGTRGSLWLTATGQDQQAEAGPSTPRLQASFGSDLFGLPSLHATSKPLPIFPPSKSSRPEPARADKRSGRPKALYNEVEDVPEELLETLTEKRSVPRLKSGAKLLVTSYTEDADKLLIIHVGGPDDRHLFISSLSPPTRQTIRPPKRKKNGLLSTADSPKQARLQQSLLPAYVSDSPIVCIKLAPREPTLRKSHQHAGPWISIQTLTGVHFSAIHQLSPRQLEKASSRYPQFVLSHICSFLTKAVASALRDEAVGVTFTLASSPISDVAWNPATKSSALLTDTAGNVWEWEVDATGHGTSKWLSRGQSCRLAVPAARNALTPAKDSQHHQILWADSFAHDRAFRVSDQSIHGLDLLDGSTEELYTTIMSPVSLQREVFRSTVSISLPDSKSAVQTRASILISATSTSIRVFDGSNPRRNLLVIPHDRDSFDESLSLVAVPQGSSSKSVVSVLLCSAHPSSTTMYTVGYAITSLDTDQEQVIRVWQAHPPAEFAQDHELYASDCQPLLRPWRDILPRSDSWSQWRKSETSVGYFACFAMDGISQVWLQGLDRKPAAHQLGPADLPIDIVRSLAADELRRLIQASSGATCHKLVGRSGSVTGKTGTPSINLSLIWRKLTEDFASPASSVARQDALLQALTKGLGHLDDPSLSMLTGLDLVSLASLHIGSETVHTPFSATTGSISASYPPHTIQIRPSHSGVLLSLLARGIKRSRGQAWWAGDRWSATGIDNDLTTSSDREDDESDEASSWEEQARQLYYKYAGEAGVRVSALIAQQELYSSCLQIVLQTALSRDVWSTRPIEVAEAKGLSEVEADERLTSQTSGLARPGPWNADFPTILEHQRRRRQDSVIDDLGATGTSTSIQRRQDSVSAASQPDSLGMQQAIDPLLHDYDPHEPQSDDEELNMLAKSRVPQPDDVRFAYFKPRRENAGRSESGPSAERATTAAARLLLSSWPLTSLDPTSTETDPSYYTYTDPYSLLDEARASGEGYASSAPSAASDGESGWSSAWSGANSGLSGGETSASEGGRSRSRSVWSASAAPSSQGGHVGSREAETPQPAQARWTRRLAPPSIAPAVSSGATAFSQSGARQGASSQHAGLGGGSRGSRGHFSQMSVQHTADRDRGRVHPMETQSQHSVGEAATQPLAGPHASRRSAPAKRQKRRVGGF